MIIRPKLNWYRMLFVWRGSVVPGIMPRLLALLLLSLLVTVFHGNFLYYKIPLNPAPFTLIGIALAIFLGFRNNASYERFWEGRKLWGALVIETRSLTRQAQTMSGYPADSPQVDRFVNLLIAFTYALKHQLRQTDAAPDLERLLPKELAAEVQQMHFKPIRLLKELGIWLQQARAEGRLDSMILSAFDRNLNKLSEIVAGCERIAGTPIPFTYSVLLHRTVYLYCLLLPFGLVDSIGWMTPIMTVFIGYTFIALDALISEIEDPFGTEPNDLALNLMSQTIEATLLEMQGKPTPGFPPPPQNDYYFD